MESDIRFVLQSPQPCLAIMAHTPWATCPKQHYWKTEEWVTNSPIPKANAAMPSASEGARAFSSYLHPRRLAKYIPVRITTLMIAK
ncbi:hypothetical protein AB1N83_005901 [Pleurotus pulmonarius]